MKRFLLLGLILALCFLCVPVLADCVGSAPQADNQDGVCSGSVQVCDVDEWVEPNYGLISGYENPEMTCDGQDNDCDGEEDEGLTDDDDYDGYTSLDSCLGSHDDCNDSESAIHPDAAETCNYTDDDCDTQTDEGLTFDDDYDGYTRPDSCEGSQNDCDDLNDAVYPGATESCNGVDEDCDTEIDEGLTFDDDVDGYTTPDSCEGSQDDCNDNDPFTNPGASEWCDTADNDCDPLTLDGSDEVTLGNPCDGTDDDFCEEGSMACVAAYMVCDDPNDIDLEVCDGADNDCDGEVDEGVTSTFYHDADGDGYGDLYDTTQACAAPPGYVDQADDCDDSEGAINPDATEVCNEDDDDCDGEVDEGVTLTFYRDADGDGHGDIFDTTQACTAPSGYVEQGDDCDDSEGASYPGASEICDGKDNNCDGWTDEGLTFDVDADGYSTPDSCEGTKNDCDDSNDAIHPDATEVCDSDDNNCDGANNEGLTFDTDTDGYTTPDSCEGSKDDCDDNDADINPGATEVCDNIDNNCDGSIDESLTQNCPLQAGVCWEAIQTCTAGTWSTCDYGKYYEETEISCDGKDNDCDAVVDNGLTPPLNDNQIGECAGSYQACGGVSGWQNDYSGITTYEATEVSCDTLDNDCDALVDQLDSDILDPSTFSSPDVDEGQDIVLSFTPLTGATYAFDCDTDNAPDYTAFGPTATQNCPTTDNEVRNVGGKLTDEHNCVWTHTDPVTVSNLNPVIVGEATPQAQTVQYSDNIVDIMLTGTDVPADLADLTVDTSYTKDGGASVPDDLPDGLSLSIADCDATECSWNVTGTAGVSEGVYVITFTVADADGGSVTETATITVNREDATCELEDENLVAVKVASSGGKSPAFTLMVYVEETQPDNPADMAEPGDIDNAEITMQLVPVGPGSTVSPSGPCSSDLRGSGYDGFKIFNCPFNNVEVNTYDVMVTVNGEYYNTGTCESVLVVYDPSLGFTTGGGKFLWDSDMTNFGYTMKYNKKAQNVQGSLLMIRHTAEGIYRVKSNALYGLALSPATSPFGYATFSGKSTYLEPGSDNKGGVVFKVYVEDNNEPGKGADRFWIQVTGGISMPSTAAANAVTITGGNIVVPHTPASTRK